MEGDELIVALNADTCTLVRENFMSEIVWRKWDPNTRTAEMNRELNFIKFKGEDVSKICICRISELYHIRKTTDDIAWIAEIPEQFKKFELKSYL